MCPICKPAKENMGLTNKLNVRYHEANERVSFFLLVKTQKRTWMKTQEGWLRDLKCICTIELAIIFISQTTQSSMFQKRLFPAHSTF